MRKRRQIIAMAQPLLLTIPEVAVMLRLGRTKVYELMATEGLPFVKLGAAKRVPVASLQRWVEQRERQSKLA
jgi:excisionase family DNA binding protein